MGAIGSGARERVTVGAILGLLTVVIFAGYFTGDQIPPFDFLSAYNFEAFAWWSSAGAFDPPDWIPSLWGGYPAEANAQNASFYLPVGLAAAFGPYTLHVAAVVAALHVLGGALGMYLFARRWALVPVAALLAAVAWFFAPGFFAQASHVDIMRSYAWIPWVLLICSDRWPWRRWWSVPVAALLLWQAILGSYPGVLVAWAYVLPIWILAIVLLSRRGFPPWLIPLALAGLSATLMSLIRYLPLLLTRGDRPFTNEDLSTMSGTDFGTLLYPFDLAQFGSMMLFHSLFVPASVLALLCFIPLRDRRVAAIGSVLILTVCLGIPDTPWSNFVDQLPGMQLSRFQVSDFKVLALAALVLLGALGLNRLVRSGPWLRGSRGNMLMRSALAGLVIAVFALLPARYGYPIGPSIVQWILLAGALVTIVALRRVTARRARAVLATTLVAVAIASGSVAVSAVPGFWREDREVLEVSTLGATVDSLLADRLEQPLTVRPPRKPPPPPDQFQDNLAGEYSTAYYTGIPSLYGYVNLRGNTWFEAIRESVDNSGVPEEVDARIFWSAAGMIIAAGDVAPTAAETTECATTGNCGAGVTTTAIAWDGAGRFEYNVNVQQHSTLTANEAFYPGWSVQACSAKGCLTLEPRASALGAIEFGLPEGEWTVVLDYALPGKVPSWVAFALGILMVLAVAVARLVRLSTRHTSGSRDRVVDPDVLSWNRPWQVAEVGNGGPGIENHAAVDRILEDPAQERVGPRPDVT